MIERRNEGKKQCYATYEKCKLSKTLHQSLGGMGNLTKKNKFLTILLKNLTSKKIFDGNFWRSLKFKTDSKTNICMYVLRKFPPKNFFEGSFFNKIVRNLFFFVRLPMPPRL